MAEKTIKDDFSFLKDDVLGILLYGSRLKREDTRRSDIDICIVAGEKDRVKILQKVWHHVDVSGKNYDVKIFEELPLYLKAEVIENHQIIYARDKGELFEYFYKFRKLWKDQRYRNALKKEEILKML